MSRLIKIGLTGGIAAGKSTVLQRWKQAGARAIDADQLAHETLAPGTTTYQSVVHEFGKGILNSDDTVNRSKLGDIVFADERKREALNRIVHPAVHEKWTGALRKMTPGSPAVVAIPLLYEVSAEKEFDCVVAVGCGEVTQIARLKAKGLSESQARARIGAQWPVALKMERADYVIWNDGLTGVLEQQADIVWENINPAPSGIKESSHAA